MDVDGEGAGALVTGFEALVELDFLHGRERLAGRDVHTTVVVRGNEISFSQLLSEVEGGNVQDVTIAVNTITGQVTNLHHSRPPAVQSFSGATFNFTQPMAMRLDEDRFFVTTTTGNAAMVLDRFEEWLQTEWTNLRVFCTSVTALLKVECSRLTGPEPVTVTGPLTVVSSRETVPAPVSKR